VLPDKNGSDAYAEVALKEMKACKHIFDKWSDRLDEFPRTNDVQAIHDVVTYLQQKASDASQAARSVVKSHQKFSSLMAKNLAKAADSGNGLIQYDPRISNAANEIKSRSAEVGQCVRVLQEGLVRLADEIDRVRTKRKKRSFWSKLFGWITKVLKAFTTAITAASGIFGFIHPAGWAGAGILTALNSIVSSASVATGSVSHVSMKSEGQLVEMLKFFRYTIPTEITKAEKLLINVSAGQEALQVQVDVQMRQMRIDEDDAILASRHWEARSQRLMNLR